MNSTGRPSTILPKHYEAIRKQGGAIMPEMLRWLWRDYHRPDDPMDEGNRTLFMPANVQAPAAPAGS